VFDLPSVLKSSKIQKCPRRERRRRGHLTFLD
jgi:hypothetical protein